MRVLDGVTLKQWFVAFANKFFTGDFPAAVVIGNVTLASPDLLVEFDAWGFIGCGD